MTWDLSIMGTAEKKYLLLGRGNPKMIRISNGLTLQSKKVGCSMCSGQSRGAPSTAQYGSLQGTETLVQRKGKKSEKRERNISAEARPSYLKYDYLIQAPSAQRGGSPTCLHAWSALHACSLVMKETDPAQCHTSF